MSMETEPAIRVIEQSLSECNGEKVVVFLDRAELSRSCSIKVEPSQEVEVRFSKLPSVAEEDSVRVEGHGQATISEVLVKRRNVPAGENPSSDKVQKLREEFEALSRQKDDLSEALKRNEQQSDYVTKFGSNFSAIKSDGGDRNALADGMETLKNFLSFHNETMDRLYKENQELKKQESQLRDKLRAVERELRDIDRRSETRALVREVVVRLETGPDVGTSEVRLFIRYVVRQANWSPKYDIRVNGNEQLMQIQYFGVIRQSTGENWDDMDIFLSTAQPSLGGTVPELGSEKVGFKPKEPSFESRSRRMRGVVLGRGDMDDADAIQSDSISFGGGFQSARSAPMPMAHSVAGVEDSVMSASFSIQKRTTIPCDSQEHRVTIGIITLKAELEYQCVPKLDAHAYLTAKVTNLSDYPMLPGPSNVFLDNNFVFKSYMTAVSANEEFSCSLGVDPAVRVDRRPLKKFKSEHGWFGKSSSWLYSQVTEVNNTRKHPIRMKLSESFPRSTDEKIKVTLQNPPIQPGQESTKDGAAKINEKNNIEFLTDIRAGTKQVFEVRYQIEHPSGEEIQFSTSGGSRYPHPHPAMMMY